MVALAKVQTTPASATPPFDEAGVTRLLRQHYGVQANEVRALEAEHDAVYSVATTQGDRFVFRLSAANVTSSAIQCQTDALQYLAQADPELPVPRVILNRSGEATVSVEASSGRWVGSLCSFLCGIPMASTESTTAQRNALGSCLAGLDRALSGFQHEGEASAGLWEVERAHELIPLLACQTDSHVRFLATDVLRVYETRGRQRLEGLPRQFIHSDFNGKNLLVDATDSSRIVGIIDFGDLTKTARVVDLAVAIARQVTEADPCREADDIAVAYCAVLPLLAEEVRVLYPLVRVRLAMRIAVWSDRQNRGISTANEQIRRSVALLRKIQGDWA